MQQDTFHVGPSISLRAKHAAGIAKPLAQAGAWLLLFLVVGCENAQPSTGDLSNRPWLDPKLQTEGLKSNESVVRSAAAFNLGNIGAAAADAVPQLERLAKDDPEPNVRDKAATALSKIRAALGQDGTE